MKKKDKKTPRLDIETVLFLRKAHRVKVDERKENSRKECRKFKQRRKDIDEVLS